MEKVTKKNTVRRQNFGKQSANALPDSNNDKIMTALQAMCINSRFYGGANDLCSGISEAELAQEGAVDLIVGRMGTRRSCRSHSW